jgi:hypothetical protein
MKITTKQAIILGIIPLILIGISIQLVLFKSLYIPKFLPKPTIEVKIQRAGEANKLYVKSSNCYITTAPQIASILNEDEYTQTAKSIFNSQDNLTINTRVSSLNNPAKFYWANINPYFIEYSIQKNESIKIRCFDRDMDNSAIVGEKFTTIIVKDNLLEDIK